MQKLLSQGTPLDAQVVVHGGLESEFNLPDALQAWKVPNIAASSAAGGSGAAQHAQQVATPDQHERLPERSPSRHSLSRSSSRVRAPTSRDRADQLGSTASRRSLSRAPSAAAGRRHEAADVARALSRSQSAVAGRWIEAAEVARSLSRAPSAAVSVRHDAADVARALSRAPSAASGRRSEAAAVVQQLHRTASRRSPSRSPSAKRLQPPQQPQGDDLVQQLRLGPGPHSLTRSRSAAFGGSAQAGAGSLALSRASSAAGSRAGAAQRSSQQVQSARSARGGAGEQGAAAHSAAAALQRQASSRSLHEERQHQHSGWQRSAAQTAAQVGSGSPCTPQPY